MAPSSSLSLRVRLTLWYGIALALILVVFSGVLYTVTAKGLRDQVDGDLREAADAAVRSLKQSQMGPIFNFEELASKFPELAVLDKFFQILTPTGRIFIESPNIKARDILPSLTALARARNGEVWIESVRIPDTPRLRIITVPVMFNKTLVNIVRAGTSLQPVEETLHRLLLVLLLTAPVGLSVALVGGWFLADRALRPVEGITLAAQRIAGGDLTQRLAVPATADEIGRLAATFNDMISRLDGSFRQVRQFGTDASHELRTPLTVLKGETELALRRPRGAEEYRLVLESSLEEIDRMTRIVDELFFLSRADLGEVKMESVPVRLDTLLEDLGRQAVTLAQDTEVEVVQSPLSPCLVMGDELRLRELILNLVDNAIKYSRPGGKVEIGLDRRGDRGRVTVRDQGIGIEPEALPRIFDRFYRSDSARTHVKKGTGLGLSICKWIAEVHQGTIEVRSTTGQGSTFTLDIPIAPSAS